MNKRPLLVGVTGGIGAGKSVICKIFNQLGVPAYDADSRAKWLMNNDSHLIKEIRATFGANSYNIDGTLNREYLAKNVFNNPKALEKLNALVHPQVRKDFDQWVTKNSKNAYLIKEAALLFESGAAQALDEIIVVTADKETRIERVLLRDPHRSKDQVLAIMENQMSETQRKKRADHLVQNDDDQLVIPQVLSLHQKFKSQSVVGQE